MSGAISEHCLLSLVLVIVMRMYKHFSFLTTTKYEPLFLKCVVAIQLKIPVKSMIRLAETDIDIV